MLGVTPDTLDLEAITYKIRDAGYKVGITSTVTLDHATPAAFYAHSAYRNDYYHIAVQLPEPVLIFGRRFIQPEGREKDRTSVITLIEVPGIPSHMEWKLLKNPVTPRKSYCCGIKAKLPGCPALRHRP